MLWFIVFLFFEAYCRFSCWIQSPMRRMILPSLETRELYKRRSPNIVVSNVSTIDGAQEFLQGLDDRWLRLFQLTRNGEFANIRYDGDESTRNFRRHHPSLEHISRDNRLRSRSRIVREKLNVRSDRRVKRSCPIRDRVCQISNFDAASQKSSYSGVYLIHRMSLSISAPTVTQYFTVGSLGYRQYDRDIHVRHWSKYWEGTETTTQELSWYSNLARHPSVHVYTLVVITINIQAPLKCQTLIDLSVTWALTQTETTRLHLNDNSESSLTSRHQTQKSKRHYRYMVPAVFAALVFSFCSDVSQDQRVGQRGKGENDEYSETFDDMIIAVIVRLTFQGTQ